MTPLLLTRISLMMVNLMLNLLAICLLASSFAFAEPVGEACKQYARAMDIHFKEKKEANVLSPCWKDDYQEYYDIVMRRYDDGFDEANAPEPGTIPTEFHDCMGVIENAILNEKGEEAEKMHEECLSEMGGHSTVSSGSS